MGSADTIHSTLITFITLGMIKTLVPYCRDNMFFFQMIEIK